MTDAVSIAAEGRREGYLELGDIDDQQVVTLLGNAVLAVQTQRRSTTLVDPLPRHAPDGFIDYGLGDTVIDVDGVNPVRVVGLTVSMDEEGRASVIPELRDRVSVREEQVNRLVKRMIDGALGGTTDSARRSDPAPVISRPARVYEIALFSYDGTLIPGLVSPPYNPPFPCQITQLVLNLRVPGSTSTSVLILDPDGAPIIAETIAASRRLQAFDLDPVYVSPLTQLRATVFVAGTGAAGLGVQLRATAA